MAGRDDEDLQATVASKGITDEDLQQALDKEVDSAEQEEVGSTMLGMQAIPREEMRRMLAERKAKKAQEELEALSSPPPRTDMTPSQGVPAPNPSASGAYPMPSFDHSHEDVHHAVPEKVELTGNLKLVSTIWEAVVRQGLGIAVLFAVLAGFHFEYLAPGKRLGGADIDQLKVVHAKVDGLTKAFGETCGQVPGLNTSALTAMQDKVDSGIRASRIKDRQSFMRLLFMFQDTVDTACSQGGRKWKKKWMREAEELLDEDEKDVEDAEDEDD